MSLRFVVIVENLAARTEAEINAALALPRDWSGWESISHEGRAYASWFCAPRYFQPEEHPEEWEAMRKYLLRARAFLGGGKAPDGWLAEPDLDSHPELAQV